MFNNYSHTIRASYIAYMTHAAINNFAPLLFLTFQNSYSINIERIAMLVGINFGVQLTVDLLAAKYADMIGYKPLIVASQIFAALGLVGLGTLPELLPDAYLGLLVSVVLYGMGGGIMEVLISPIVEACPTEKKSASMSLLHSFYCWGHVAVILVSTGFFVVFGIENWRILACMWAIMPALNAFYFSRTPIAMLNQHGESMGIKALVSTKLFWLLMLLMICSGASEQAMVQWASFFAESGLNISKTLGDLAGPGVFAALMGVVRVLYSKFSEKINLKKFIAGSGCLCIVTYLTASLSASPLIGLIACALCGLSVGIMWPGILSIAAEKCPRGGTALFALLALGGDVGCSGGPTLVGFVSGALEGGIKAGIAAGVVFPVLLVLGLIPMFFYRKNNRV
ncbi:MAG: MFS transporter [Oscillospiraceae bacterium]|nr:MFS transporter [Oscillospiraceae bacterium]